MMIVKSGWPTFDLSRTYGFGIVLYSITESDVKIYDRNYYFQIEAPPLPTKINVKGVSHFLGDDLNWRETLLSAPRFKDKKKKMEYKVYIKNFFNTSRNIRGILKKYSKPKAPEIPSKGETLYISLEPAATKGTRDTIRLKKQYSEGENISVDTYDWMLSILGHLNITVWSWNRNFDSLLMAMPIPSPNGTNISNLLSEIKKIIIEKKLRRMHIAGTAVTLSFIGVELTKAVLNLFESPFEYKPQFHSILHNSLVFTGRGITKRPKPSIFGIFSLEFLNKIGKSKKANEILGLWEDIFNKTNRPGYEDLALCLSEFITYPSRETLDKYLRAHLRTFLNKDIKPKLYKIEVIKEVLKNV